MSGTDILNPARCNHALGIILRDYDGATVVRVRDPGLCYELGDPQFAVFRFCPFCAAPIHAIAQNVPIIGPEPAKRDPWTTEETIWDWAVEEATMKR